jgi:AcrR family transcriptional regulator
MATGMSRAPAGKARPALSREVIAETAMRMTLDQPTTPLTLTRLGAELAADPTALYRHFRSRDELIRELGDRLYAEIGATVEITSDWAASLQSVATTVRSVLLQRPALAADLGTRFTGGDHERDGVRRLREVFVAAGFPEDQIARQVQGFGELMLAHVVMTASLLCMSLDQQEYEHRVSLSLYGPHTSTTSLELEDNTFAGILDTYLSGLRLQLEQTSRHREGVNMINEQRGEL